MLKSPSIETNIPQVKSKGEWTKPFFGLNSLRSATYIFSWSLGRHLNVIALEESARMGYLAIGRVIQVSGKNRKR